MHSRCCYAVSTPMTTHQPRVNGPDCQACEDRPILWHQKGAKAVQSYESKWGLPRVIHPIRRSPHHCRSGLLFSHMQVTPVESYWWWDSWPPPSYGSVNKLGWVHVLHDLPSSHVHIIVQAWGCEVLQSHRLMKIAYILCALRDVEACVLYRINSLECKTKESACINISGFTIQERCMK